MNISNTAEMRSVLSVALLCIASSAGAAQLHTLHTPYWVNYWPGFNQFAEFGFNDDVIFDPALQSDPSNMLPGQPLNPTGSTSSYHFTDAAALGVPATGLFMGYSSGTTTTAGPFGAGVNHITAIDATFDFNIFSPYGNGADIDEAGNPTTPTSLNVPGGGFALNSNFNATMTVHPGNVITSDYYYRQVDGNNDPVPGSTYRAMSSAYYILNGQNPADIFAGDQPTIDAFTFSIAVLNSSPATAAWTLLALELGSFQFADEVTGLPIVGLETLGGFSSAAYFSLDTVVVPIPAALPLLVSSMIGLLTVARRRRRA